MEPVFRLGCSPESDDVFTQVLGDGGVVDVFGQVVEPAPAVVALTALVIVLAAIRRGSVTAPAGFVVPGADVSPGMVQASNAARHSNGAANMVRLPLPAVIRGPPLL